MRAIDYWVGIPLTFLLTIVCRVQRLIGLASSPAGRPRNILFIQLAEMGTMVVAYPSLRKARELYPDATLHFLCFKQIRSSVEILEIIPSENIITLDAHSGLSLARDTLRFLWRARRRGIDTVINMEAFVRYSSLLSYLSGASRRVGFHRFNQEGLYCGDLLTHKVLHNSHVHAAHTFLDLVHALDTPPDQVPRVKRPTTMDCLDVPKISTDANAAAGIWRKLRAIHADIGPTRKLVVINPNASDKFPMRRWPLESFTELARQLLEDPEVFVLITGVAGEKPDAQSMCAQLASPRALDLTGQTTMTELLHLFDLAHVLVTNDSGPAHFAALTRIREVVFFGPEIPGRYRPLTTNSDVIHTGYSCSPCIGPLNQRRSPCNDNVCLKSIRVEEITVLVRSHLEAARSSAAPVGGARSSKGDAGADQRSCNKTSLHTSLLNTPMLHWPGSGAESSQLADADSDGVAASGKGARAALETRQRDFHGFARFHSQARIDVTRRRTFPFPPIERRRSPVASRLEGDRNALAFRRRGDVPEDLQRDRILGDCVEVERYLPMRQCTNTEWLRTFATTGHALDEPQVDPDQPSLQTFVWRVFDGHTKRDAAQLNLFAAAVQIGHGRPVALSGGTLTPSIVRDSPGRIVNSISSLFGDMSLPVSSARIQRSRKVTAPSFMPMGVSSTRQADVAPSAKGPSAPASIVNAPQGRTEKRAPPLHFLLTGPLENAPPAGCSAPVVLTSNTFTSICTSSGV